MTIPTTEIEALCERLRQGAGYIPEDIQTAEEAMDKAADAIERLTRELAALAKKALELGLIEQTIYDPAIHGESDAAEGKN